MAVAVYPEDVERHAEELREEATELRRQATIVLQEAEQRAEQLRRRALEREEQSRVALARAERMRNPEMGVQIRKPKLDDPLLSAAALAAEDMRGSFAAEAFGQQLGVGKKRALDLLVALASLGAVELLENGWRAFDPDDEKVRDAVIELGEFTREGLAEHVGMTVEAIDFYLADLAERGVVTFAESEDAELAYAPTGPERVITRRPRRPLPEHDRPAGTEILSPRGVVQETSMSATQRRQAMSQPGVRLRVKNKERQKARAAAARDARAQQNRERQRRTHK